jgi:hypothetical protein
MTCVCKKKSLLHWCTHKTGTNVIAINCFGSFELGWKLSKLTYQFHLSSINLFQRKQEYIGLNWRHMCGKLSWCVWLPSSQINTHPGMAHHVDCPVIWLVNRDKITLTKTTLNQYQLTSSNIYVDLSDRHAVTFSWKQTAEKKLFPGNVLLCYTCLSISVQIPS